MAKITSLAELMEVADDDLLVVVDKSDTSMAESGTNKKVTLATLLDFFYPVGTIYQTTSSDLDTTAKMNAHFGGTWEVYGAGRVLVAKSSDAEFDTIGKTGGEKAHTLTETEMPSHKHIVKYESIQVPTSGSWRPFLNESAGGQHSTTYTGGGQAHNNLQPYIVVYQYRRIE